ncbi:MAG: hypothetical protein ACREMA_08925 [Longimicrobiales bacterium]
MSASDAVRDGAPIGVAGLDFHDWLRPQRLARAVEAQRRWRALPVSERPKSFHLRLSAAIE